VEPYSRSRWARLGRALSRALGALFHSSRRSAFVRELFFRLARRFTGAIVVESHGLRYLVGTDDRGVGMTLFMGQNLERRTLDCALRTLEAAGVDFPTGQTLVDVGAHVGTTSVTALGAFDFERAICFEPSPRNRELLSANLALNGLRDRATVVPVALSDRAGTASFEIAPMNPSDGRVRVPDATTDAGAFGEEGWSTIEVRTAPFDSFVDSGEVDLAAVGIVWIDAQGHEGHVLRGASSVLERRIPVLTEFWPYGLRRAGGLDLLVSLISERFRLVVDMERAEEGRGVPRPAREIAMLVEEHPGVAHTDLLLIP
jgi:FkbM family methyltransferase